MRNIEGKAFGKFIGIVAWAFLILAPISSMAQEKFKYLFKDPVGINKYVEQHVLDVGDVAGHQIRVASLETKYADEAPEYAGVKGVGNRTWLTSDYVNGTGRFSTYGVTQMANGDKIFTRAEGLSQTTFGADGSRKTAYSQVTTLTGGTGKFGTIRGVMKTGGTTDFKTGVITVPSEGEYWFEK